MATQEVAEGKSALSYLHSVLCRPAISVCSQVACSCAKVVYSLEQRIFLALEFQHLTFSIVKTRHSFLKKFNVTKGPIRYTIKAVLGKFQAETSSISL